MPDPSAAPAGSRTRPGPRWHRSLYWRIGAALIALVAMMLVAEGALFLWLSDRTAGAMPGRDPQQLVSFIASNLTATLAADPDTNIEQYVQDQYGHFFQTILVVMRDGRVFANHDDISSEELREASQLSFASRGGRRGRGGPPWPGFGGDGRDNPGPDDGRGPPRPSPGGNGGGAAPRPGPNDNAPSRGRPPDDNRIGLGPPRDGIDGRPRRPPSFRGELAPIFADGSQAGLVALVQGNPPFSRIVRLVGSTMGLVAGGVLIVGGSLIALLVFGPARKRLLQVQQATERLGSGDLMARAPEHGGDEISAVARSFNRMADELTRRAQALDSSDKARRQLLADVSHELMTPLTAMRGYIETLGMANLRLDPPTRERYMRVVSEETHRLEHIVGDLLDLARLEGGGTTMRRERVPVDMLFDRVSERHERELSARSIHLERRISSGGDDVMGDHDRLERALQNLMANALRYTPDGGRITLDAIGAADGVHITVRDSGPGIPADHLALIFDRFYKVDAARMAAAGSGLGLSIVKAIIERHGGTITARNDSGAVFEIVLPGA